MPAYACKAIGNITSNAGNAYTYGDAAHKHAVTAAFGNTYGYDANGNQTTRTIGGVTYTFTYDYENRVTAIAGGSTSASFVYDTSGMRVKGTVNGVTTVYIAGVYEYQGGATTLYYDGNAIRRTGYPTNNGVTYLLQDHLKSSSKIINQNGTLHSQNYYYPLGGNRGGAAFSSVTTKRFTGQYHEKDLPGGEGVSYYGARWYDAQVGRFLSADSIVPKPGNLQELNRYSYAMNNAVRYSDPTGHFTEEQLVYWFGSGWRKQFTAEWQSVLLDDPKNEIANAQLGDALMVQNAEGMQNKYVFVVDQQEQLTLWDVQNRKSQSLQPMGQTTPHAMGLYRYEGAETGRTRGITDLNKTVPATNGWNHAEERFSLMKQKQSPSAASATNMQEKASLPNDWFLSNDYTYYISNDRKYASSVQETFYMLVGLVTGLYGGSPGSALGTVNRNLKFNWIYQIKACSGKSGYDFCNVTYRRYYDYYGME